MYPEGVTDRDLTFDEVKRFSRRAFGDQGAILAEPGRCLIGRFLDGLGQRPLDADGHPIPPNKRPYQIYGSGPTWAEAIRRTILKTRGH